MNRIKWLLLRHLSASVSMFLKICASPASELFNGFYSYSVLKSVFAMGLCPVNMNILAQEIMVFQMSPNTQNDDFPQNGCNGFYQIVLFYGDRLPKYNSVGDVFRIITINTLGAQTRNVDFVEAGFLVRCFHCCSVFINQKWSTEQHSISFLR
jgi:hypothetical protein